MSSNIFFIKFSNISGKRLDPKYNDYLNKYSVAFKNSQKLGTLLKTNPMYGANESAIEYNGKCRYIRITDIDEYGLLKKAGKKSAKFEDEKYKLNINDILFARSGATVGKTYIHKDSKLNAIFAGYMIKMQINERKINPDYVFYYTQLDIYKQWTQAIQRSAGQPNINAEEYQDLDIPIPSSNVQKNIVSLMKYAYEKKLEKEQEAQDKLDSIDAYLLGMLDITSSRNKRKSLGDRVFFRKFSEVSGSRIDPQFYSHEFYNYEKSLKEKPFKKFKYFIKSINNGFDFRDYKEQGIPYLKVANIKKGSLDFSKIQYIDFDSSQVVKNIQLEEGNLLLTRKGTFGNAFALSENLNYVISSEIFYIEIENSINVKFLEIFFNSKIGQLQFDKNKIGAIMGSLSQDAIRELLIPTPSFDVQQKILTRVTTLKNEAKALKEEAMQIYNEVKEEVEKLILGKTND